MKAAVESAGRLGGRWPYLLIVLLSVSMFGGALPADRVWSPADILVDYYPWRGVILKNSPANRVNSDVALQMNPWLVYASEQIRAGKFPLWNPHSFGGVPFHGNMISAVFSPFNVPAYLIPVQWALSIQPMLKTAIAGASMLWFLRMLGLAAAPALLGAVAFMFNGFIVVWLGAPETSVAAWLPLLAGLTERLRRTGSWRASGFLALAVLVQFLGGHPETSMHILLVAAIYAAFRARGPGGRRFLWMFIAAVAAGTALASFQILPFLDYLSRSMVLQARTTGMAIAGNSLRGFVAMLVPDFFGNPIYENYRGVSLALGSYHMISGSVGIVPWLLAPLAFVLYRSGRAVPFFAFAFGAGMLLVFDRTFTPKLLGLVPGYSLVAPSTHQFRLMLAFGLSGLAAVGMDALLSEGGEPGKRRKVARTARAALVFVLLVVVLSLAAFGGEMNEHGMVPFVLGQMGLYLAIAGLAEFFILRQARLGTASRAAIPALLALEIMGSVARVPFFNPIIPDWHFFPKSPALEFIRKDPGLFRTVFPLPNVGMVYGMDAVGGYDAMTPLRFKRLMGDEDEHVGHGNSPFSLGVPLDSPLAALMNIKYVMRRPDSPSPGSGYVLAYSGPDGKVYRNTRVLPRAFLVSRHVTYGTDEEIRRLLRDGKADPRRVMLSLGAPGTTEYPADPKASAQVESNEPDRVVIGTSSRMPAFLVLSDRYSPRWSVKVDGKPQEILRVNYVFRGVKLPAGRHTVEFAYFPLFFYVGLAISGATLFLVGLMLVKGAPARN